MSDNLAKSKYVKRTGVPGHYHYEYAKDAADTASRMAYSSSSRGQDTKSGQLKGNAAQMVRHQEAQSMHQMAGHAAEQQMASKTDGKALRNSHGREAARHSEKAYNLLEKLSDSELEDVYHHHQENTRRRNDSDHDGRAHHSNNAAAAAMELTERYTAAGDSGKAARWRGNFDMTSNSADHHTNAAANAGSPLYRRLKAPAKKSDSAYVPDLTKGGEGSRGGHVIGHTSSGKAIYASKSASDFHAHHHEMSTAEHREAEAFHRAGAKKEIQGGAFQVGGKQEKLRAHTHAANAHANAAQSKHHSFSPEQRAALKEDAGKAADLAHAARSGVKKSAPDANLDYDADLLKFYS